MTNSIRPVVVASPLFQGEAQLRYDHRPKSRVREIRQHGSEGGGPEHNRAFPTPLGPYPNPLRATPTVATRIPSARDPGFLRGASSPQPCARHQRAAAEKLGGRHASPPLGHEPHDGDRGSLPTCHHDPPALRVEHRTRRGGDGKR